MDTEFQKKVDKLRKEVKSLRNAVKRLRETGLNEEVLLYAIKKAEGSNMATDKIRRVVYALEDVETFLFPEEE
jgi:hypothetical protein